MAKKKKISKDLLMVLTVLVFALAIGAVCMMFLPALKLTGKTLGTNETVAGIYAVFGYSKTSSTGIASLTTVYAHFNVGALIGYYLALAAAVLAILAFKAKGKLVYYLVALLLIASGVLIFCEGAFFASVNTDTAWSSNLYNVSLGFGPIFGGILAILGGLVSGVAGYLKK